jgi:prefoldin subunit 5
VKGGDEMKVKAEEIIEFLKKKLEEEEYKGVWKDILEALKEIGERHKDLAEDIAKFLKEKLEEKKRK